MTKNPFLLLATAASLPTLASSSSPFHRFSSAFVVVPSHHRLGYPPTNLATNNNRRRSRKIADNDSAVVVVGVPTTTTTTTTTTSTSSSSSSLLAATPPGKGELYDDEELFDLLTLHQALYPEEDEKKKGLFSGDNVPDVIGVDTNGENLNEESIAAPGGIHDWVLQTLNDDADATTTSSNTIDNGVGQSIVGDEYPTDASAIPGLHDLILETIEQIDSSSSSNSSPQEDDDKEDNESPTTINQLAFDNLQMLLRDKKPSIRAIATDVDGTLLSGTYLHPITRDAILKAIDQAYNHSDGEKNSGTSSSSTTADTPPSAEEAARQPPKIRHFFPATGKSRRGAELSLGPVIGPLLHRCPGVYIQGLYCVDGMGNVVFERKLSSAAVRAAEDLVAEFEVSIVGYDGDDLYTTRQTEVVRSLSEVYGEPPVQLLIANNDEEEKNNDNNNNNSAINYLADYQGGMHKLLLMDEDLEKLAGFRPRLELLASKHGATVTQAIPTMLELLPGGCSKGHGVKKLCEALGVTVSDELLALGDAENDAGMLEDAAIGVAVGNACPMAMDAADFIMRECHEEGGAGLAMELFGF